MKRIVLEFFRSKYLDRKSRKPRLFTPLFCVALVLGVIVHVIVFVAFRVTTNTLPQNYSQTAFLQYTGNNSAAAQGQTKENALLFDSAPLFIPTKWNAAQNLVSSVKKSSNTSLGEYEPAIDLLTDLAPVNLPLPREHYVAAPIDLLDSKYWLFFFDFGVFPQQVEPFADSDSVALIRSVNEVSTYVSQQLTARLNWDKDQYPEGVARFYILQSRAGFNLSGPILSQSSGSLAFDEAALGWLQSPKTIAQLVPGYLEVSVYP